jgi:Co/Zn/Cd efflux system component
MASTPPQAPHVHAHEHGPGPGSDRRYLLVALGLLAAFMLAEVITAILSGSLALLSDAGHMLSDVGAIGGALWAMALAARPPSGKWTYGWKRAEILSAAANGIIGTVIAGIIIVTTGLTRADAIASLVVVILMAKAAWELLRDSGRVLLEAAPEDMDLEQVRAHLSGVAHVLGVHDLHAWTVTSGLPALSAHIVIEDGCFHDGHAPRLLDQLQACLAGHFDVEHSTFQLEATAHAGHEPGTH